MKQGWITTTLDEACNVEYGTRVVQKRDGGTAYPVYGGGGATFQMDTYNREDRVVVSRFGMSPQCTRYVSGRFFLNDSGLTLSSKNTELLTDDYLGRLTLSLNDAIYALGKGQAQRNLNVSAFRALPISIPTIAEQKRICAILDEALEAIQTAEGNAAKNLLNAGELFESQLNAALTLPNGIDTTATTLGAETDLQVGFAFKSADFTEAQGDIRLLRGDNIVPGGLRWDGVKRYPVRHARAYQQFALAENDVVLAMDRPWISTGLKRAQVRSDDLPCLLVQRTARMRGKASLDNRFLYYLIGTRKFISHLVGNQTGLGVPHISGQQIKGFQFRKPTLREQQRVASELDCVWGASRRLATTAARKVGAIVELRKSVLNDAFAGRL